MVHVHAYRVGIDVKFMLYSNLAPSLLGRVTTFTWCICMSVYKVSIKVGRGEHHDHGEGVFQNLAKY